MGSSPGFGSNPCHFGALFRLAFATAADGHILNLATRINSPAHSSIGTPSSARRRTLTACRHAVSDLFHSPPGVLFTFPSRYWYAIGRQEYLALESGLPSFPQDFPCPVVLSSAMHGAFSLRLQDYHLLWWPFPRTFGWSPVGNSARDRGISPITSRNPGQT